MKNKSIDNLNAPDKKSRLEALKELMILYDTGALDIPITGIM